MSLSLLKYQTDEGYPYSPTSQKLINFTVPRTMNPCDFSKSYIVCNVSLTGIVNVGNYGFYDTLNELKPVSMFKNAKLWSNNNNTLYDEVRNVNVLAHNRDFYTEDINEIQLRKVEGMGFSNYDDLKTVSYSIFSRKFKKTGTTASALTNGNCIIPLKDLWNDLGSMVLFPSHLLNLRMELEIEDNKSIINEKLNLSGLLNYSISKGSNLPIGDIANTNVIVPMVTYGDGTRQNVQKSPYYVGQTLKVQALGGVTNVTINTSTLTITRIDISNGDASFVDAWGSQIPRGGLKITLDGNFYSAIADNTNSITGSLSVTEVSKTGNTPSFQINDASLVLCEKKFNPEFIEEYNKQLLENGLVYQRWVSENFNLNNDNYQKYFDVDPMTSVILFSLPTQDFIYSTNGDEFNSYRLEWNNKQTSNRDININSLITVDLGSLYRHKVELGVDRMGKKLKNLLTRTVETDDDTYFSTSSSVTNIWEPIPEVPKVSSLKLELKSNNITERQGNLYKLVRRKVSFN